MSQNKAICGLILAAGMSSRMQEFKPLMQLRGKTLIENTVDSMFNGGAERIVVVTGYRGDELENLLHSKYGEKIITVRNYDYATTDMLCSVKIGCKCMPNCKAFFLLPGDMPVIKKSTFERLLGQKDDKISVVFPTLNGFRKHPPLIDARFIPKILEFCGNGGLREFWKQYESAICTVPVDDDGVWVDLDTKEDYNNCKLKYEN